MIYRESVLPVRRTMCGLLGIAYRNGASAVKRSLCVDGIRNRGPDNVGHVNYGPVEFVHSRLAIIDRKETSNQPIASEDGKLSMMCNGEIYNHLSLRKSLPYRYRTSSDCEVVLGAYSNSGVDGLSHLDGMYAAVIYDAREHTLLLHRDSVGKKPLFWYVDNEEFIFSSNVHAISTNLRRPPKLDLEQVQHYMHNGFVHPCRSIYHSIQPVLPGEVIRIDLATWKISRAFVEIKDAFDGFDYSNRKAVQYQIELLIDAAVHKRLHGLTRPVIMFSGGIDSTVVATACKGVESAVLMTLKQPLPWLNDEPFAIQEAQRLRRSLIFADPWDNFGERIARSLEQLDQPLSLPSYFVTSLLTMEAKRFGNVIITGDGGDEVFFGYKPFSEWVSTSRDREPMAESIACGAPFGFALSDYGIRQSSIDLVGHSFVKVDKATAENQMEARCPLVDRRLIAFIRSIPIEYWQATSNIPKAPLVSYLLDRGVGYDSVFRKKIGTAWPLRYRMVTSYPRMIRELEAQRDRLCVLGIELSRKWSPLSAFRKFDRFWNEYVLAKYINRVHRD